MAWHDSDSPDSYVRHDPKPTTEDLRAVLTKHQHLRDPVAFHRECTSDVLRETQDALATALERLEALERGVLQAMQKMKARPGEPLDFLCQHCGKKTPLVVDALVAALARSTEEAKHD